MVNTRNWHQLKSKVIKVDSTVESMCVLSYIFLRGSRNVNINPVFVRSYHSQTKGRTIRKLIGRGKCRGGGARTKKNSRKGKLNEKKIHARQLTPNHVYATA